jgi:hypothetical protein
LKTALLTHPTKKANDNKKLQNSHTDAPNKKTIRSLKTAILTPTKTGDKTPQKNAPSRFCIMTFFFLLCFKHTFVFLFVSLFRTHLFSEVLEDFTISGKG